MASKRREEKLNKERQKLVKERDKLLAKAAKKGRYSKYEKKLLAAKKIGIFIPVEGEYYARISKNAGILYTVLMGLLLSLGLNAAYFGMCNAFGINIRGVVVFFCTFMAMMVFMFCRSYLGKNKLRGAYALSVALIGLYTYYNRKEIVKCIVNFGDHYFNQYEKYTGSNTLSSLRNMDITVMFIVLGVISALLIAATVKSSSGSTMFMVLTLPWVIICMLVGLMPQFGWFVVYGTILVGVTCADGIVGYREYGKQTGFLKKEVKSLKKRYAYKGKEQATTGAYVKVMLMSMVATLVVMLTTALVYPKADYEETEAKQLRKDLENSLVDMEAKLNEGFNIDLGIADKIVGENLPDIGEGKGELPDIKLDIDALMKRIKKGGGIGFGVIPEGEIDLDAKEKRLEVTLGKLQGNLYLKGYVADAYEDGRWVFSGATKQDITYATDFLIMKNEEDLFSPQQSIVVDNVNDNSGVDFIPYFTKENIYDYEYSDSGEVVSNYEDHGYFKKYDISLDDITSPRFSFGESVWSIACMNNSRFVSDEELMAFNHQYLADNFGDEYRQELVDGWIRDGYVIDVKNDILISNDMFVTDSAEMYQYNKAKINSKIIDNVVFVQNYLSKNMTYTLAPPKNDSGLDNASFFLKESKQGYCMHFATTGALLLAQMGVPVRYAEGYVITKDNYLQAVTSDLFGEMIEVEEDFSAEIKDYSHIMYTVPVYGANAHAWVEVYLMGIGWVPVEMTKVGATGEGFESVIEDAFDEAKPPTKEPVKTKEPQSTKEPQNSKEPEKSKEPQKTEKPQPTKTPKATKEPQSTKAPQSEDTSNISPVVIGVAIGVVCVVGLITAYMLYRKLRLLKINRMLLTRRGTLKYIFRTIEALSGKKGIVYANDLRYDEYGKELGTIFQCISEEQGIEYMAAISKELFSKEGITDEEFDMVKKVYMEIVKEVLERGNKLYVLYLKSILLIQKEI